MTFTLGDSQRCKFVRLHDRVVVRRSDRRNKTAGGIVLPGSAAEKPNTGRRGLARRYGRTGWTTVKSARWL